MRGIGRRDVRGQSFGQARWLLLWLGCTWCSLADISRGALRISVGAQLCVEHPNIEDTHHLMRPAWRYTPVIMTCSLRASGPGTCVQPVGVRTGWTIRALFICYPSLVAYTIHSTIQDSHVVTHTVHSIIHSSSIVFSSIVSSITIMTTNCLNINREQHHPRHDDTMPQSPSHPL